MQHQPEDRQTGWVVGPAPGIESEKKTSGQQRCQGPAGQSDVVSGAFEHNAVVKDHRIPIEDHSHGHAAERVDQHPHNDSEGRGEHRIDKQRPAG